MGEKNNRNFIEKNEVTGFITRVSSEMRSQMSTIIGSIELISHEDMSMQVAESFRKIRNSAENMSKIMDDVVDLAGISSGSGKIAEKEYCLVDIIRNTRRRLERRTSEANVDFSVDVDDQLPFRLIGDGERLERMIAKLIVNAINSVGEVAKKRKGCIKVDFKRMPAINGNIILRVDVTDNGSGILSQDLLGVLQGSSLDETSGKFGNFEKNAMMIYIVRYFALMMGGKLSVHCRKDIGATFTLLVTQKLIGNGVIADYEVEETEEKTEIIAPKARVLLVDTDKCLGGLFDSLKRYEIMPDICFDITGADEIAMLAPYNLVVLYPDCNPSQASEFVSGIKALAKKRGAKYNNLKNVKLVALTHKSRRTVQGWFGDESVDGIFGIDEISNPEALLRAMLPPEIVESRGGEGSKRSLIEFLRDMGLDVDYALENFNNDIDELKNVLKSLCRSSDTKAKLLNYYLEQHDYKNYIVAVHGIFGVAKMIGANRLAKKTMELEHAARQGMSNILERETLATTELFEKLLTSIRSAIISNDEVAIKGAVDKDDLVELIVELKKCLEDFQLNDVEELFYTLAQCSYPNEDVVAAIHKAEEYMLNYQYNEVHQVLDEILLILGKEE